MKKIIKWFFILIIALINVLIIGRVIISTDKTVFNELTVTENLSLEYAKSDSIQILTHKVGGDLSAEGLFCAYSMYYIPEARELQVTVRYNKSAYKYTETDTSKEFDFRLYNAETEEYYKADTVGEKKRFMYTFKRLIFNDVEFDDTANLNVVMGFDENVFDEMIIHYREQEFEEYKLSKSEKNDLSDMAYGSQ